MIINSMSIGRLFLFREGIKYDPGNSPAREDVFQFGRIKRLMQRSDSIPCI